MEESNQNNLELDIQSMLESMLTEKVEKLDKVHDDKFQYSEKFSETQSISTAAYFVRNQKRALTSPGKHPEGETNKLNNNGRRESQHTNLTLENVDEVDELHHNEIKLDLKDSPKKELNQLGSPSFFFVKDPSVMNNPFQSQILVQNLLMENDSVKNRNTYKNNCLFTNKFVLNPNHEKAQNQNFFERGTKRFNTIHTNVHDQNLFINNISYANYEAVQRKPAHHLNSSTQIGNLLYPRRLISDQTSFIYNEYDKILDNCLKTEEKITEEVYYQLKGNFFTILQTQNGSRVIQKCIRRTHPEIISNIFHEVKFKIHELMVDSYANYFCQRIFPILAEKDQLEFIYSLENNFVDICNNKIGTYSIQSLIDNINKENIMELFISVFQANFKFIINDLQGVHVVEKVILCFSEFKIIFLYDYVMDNLFELSSSQTGLCVVKKVITKVSDQSIIQKILNKTIEIGQELIHNQYGNYALQTIFESWSIENYLPLIRNFYTKLCELATQKYSSYVVEFFFEKGGIEVINQFIDEICSGNKTEEILKNTYGNHVLKKLLKVSVGFNRKRLFDSISKNLDKINDRKLIYQWKPLLDSYLEIQEQGNFMNYNNSINPLNIINSMNNNNINRNPYPNMNFKQSAWRSRQNF